MYMIAPSAKPQIHGPITKRILAVASLQLRLATRERTRESRLSDVPYSVERSKILAAWAVIRRPVSHSRDGTYPNNILTLTSILRCPLSPSNQSSSCLGRGRGIQVLLSAPESRCVHAHDNAQLHSSCHSIEPLTRINNKHHSPRVNT